MGVPFTKNGGIKKIKAHKSFEILSCKTLAIADVEALVGENENPTFMNNIQIQAIAGYIHHFSIREKVQLMLMWPNGAFLTTDVSTGNIYWLSREDVDSWNERMLGFR